MSNKQINTPIMTMDLRDYFAAAALMGLRSGFNLDYSKCAQEAYQIADAMMEEKNKG